jgi:hypothetical protein
MSNSILLAVVTIQDILACDVAPSHRHAELLLQSERDLLVAASLLLVKHLTCIERFDAMEPKGQP